MAVYGDGGFRRAIHNIENSPFRTKFDRELDELEGTMGIGCISDMDPQPLLIRSHLGSYAITTVGVIRNEEELIREAYENGHVHFMDQSSGRINSTELVAAMIDQQESFADGLLYAQERIQGSMSILILTPKESMLPVTVGAGLRYDRKKGRRLLRILREFRLFEPGIFPLFGAGAGRN